MDITPERQREVAASLGEHFPQTLMTALRCAMNYLGEGQSREDRASDPEFRAVNGFYWRYINLCLGLPARQAPDSEADARNKSDIVFEAASIQQTTSPD